MCIHSRKKIKLFKLATILADLSPGLGMELSSLWFVCVFIQGLLHIILSHFLRPRKVLSGPDQTSPVT